MNKATSRLKNSRGIQGNNINFVQRVHQKINNTNDDTLSQFPQLVSGSNSGTISNLMHITTETAEDLRMYGNIASIIRTFPISTFPYIIPYLLMDGTLKKLIELNIDRTFNNDLVIEFIDEQSIKDLSSYKEKFLHAYTNPIHFQHTFIASNQIRNLGFTAQAYGGCFVVLRGFDKNRQEVDLSSELVLDDKKHLYKERCGETIYFEVVNPIYNKTMHNYLKSISNSNSEKDIMRILNKNYKDEEKSITDILNEINRVILKNDEKSEKVNNGNDNNSNQDDYLNLFMKDSSNKTLSKIEKVHKSRVIFVPSTEIYPNGHPLAYKNYGFGGSIIDTFLPQYLDYIEANISVRSLLRKANLFVINRKDGGDKEMERMVNQSSYDSEASRQNIGQTSIDFESMSPGSAIYTANGSYEISNVQVSLAWWPEMLDKRRDLLMEASNNVKRDISGDGANGITNGEDVNDQIIMYCTKLRNTFQPYIQQVLSVMFFNQIDITKDNPEIDFSHFNISFESPVKPSMKERTELFEKTANVLMGLKNQGIIDNKQTLDILNNNFTDLFGTKMELSENDLDKDLEKD